MDRRSRIALAIAFALVSCRHEHGTSVAAVQRPSILLVTLDTTRADALAADAHKVDTPAFDALEARGCTYTQAYATVPETLPSHASMMTGLYAAGHGVHENGHRLPDGIPLAAEELKRAGYSTAAFVSTFALSRQFGLARGFDTYDDDISQRTFERSSRETTDRAIAWIAEARPSPHFLWVHYYDAHHPYTPPEPYRSRYAAQPYYGEIAEMDSQFARLLAAFQAHAKGPLAIVVVGDHGEGLGEHGEAHHRYLLYQSTMHVPLIVAAPGVKPRVETAPVSVRHIFSMLLTIARVRDGSPLPAPPREVVLGEAMMPFLEYGWQPQVMAVEGRLKTILAGRAEVYDVAGDPAEVRDLAKISSPSRAVRAALTSYPIPSIDEHRSVNVLNDEDRRKLASLGYVSSSSRPVISKFAPRPADKTALFEKLEKANAMSGMYR